MAETSETRLRHLQQNLERIVDALKTHYHPERVILFGSLASGHVTDVSDLDLLVVKETEKPFFERIKDVIAICDYDVGVDFLVYTPEELSDEVQNNAFVREEIVAKGKVVYRATT